MSENNEFLVVGVSDLLLAIPLGHVDTLVQTPAVTKLPTQPSYVRGTVRVQGRFVPLVDLRVRYGRPTLHSERHQLADTLRQREAEHRTWIAALEEAASKGERFTGQTDPGMCAFGRWYAQYQPPTESLRALFKRFEKPHGSFHGVASRCNELVDAGKLSEAMTVVKEARHRELAELLALFTQAYAALEQDVREVTVVMTRDGTEVAVAVDQVLQVETLDVRADVGGRQIAELPDNSNTVSVLDLDEILEFASRQVA